MNLLCSILARDMKSVSQQVVNEKYEGRQLKKLTSRALAIEGQIKDELSLLQKKINSKRRRLKKLQGDNGELLLLACSDELGELQKTKRSLEVKLAEVEREQLAFLVDHDLCMGIIAEVSATIEKHLKSIRAEHGADDLADVRQKLIFGDATAYKDDKNKGCTLIHYQTNGGDYLAVLKDCQERSINQVSCELSRVIYLYKGIHADLDPMVRSKGFSDLDSQEQALAAEFNSRVVSIRGRLRRMLENTKSSRESNIQMPTAQVVHDIHEKYSELAWRLAKDAGFTVLPLDPEDPYVQSAEALRHGAFNMPDDSGRVVYVGVMAYIHHKLFNPLNAVHYMAEQTADEEAVIAVNEAMAATDATSEDLSPGYECDPSTPPPRIKPPHATFNHSVPKAILLGAIEGLEITQQKLLRFTGDLKKMLRGF